MRTTLALLVLCVALSACSGGSDDRGADPQGQSSGGSDERWTDPQGQRVPNGRIKVKGEFPLTLDLKSGPSHCDWNDVDFLDLVWPLGAVVTGYSDAVRQYVWDPSDSHGFNLVGTPERHSKPPEDAVDTGYRHDNVELWIANTDAERYVYLRRSGSFERWPRSTRPILCA